MPNVTFKKQGTLDEMGMPMKEGWYFYGEDNGATIYGPYNTKEQAENALIRFADDLNKKEDQQC